MEIVRYYNNIPVRLHRRLDLVLFSAYDVATCLKLENKRKEVNLAVIKADFSYTAFISGVLFVNETVIRELAFKAEWEEAKQFIKWLAEVDINSMQLTLF